MSFLGENILDYGASISLGVPLATTFVTCCPAFLLPFLLLFFFS